MRAIESWDFFYLSVIFSICRLNRDGKKKTVLICSRFQ